ncbi:MAG: nucleotidyltransferase substrate binding protein [Dechloromonas sp.]|jgi:nucleotidyltransferase substrate binding protein (TIGR01987 family)|nr:nucleotidyltransferase substrate binding protein [Dechloromonas sp.]
MTGSDADVRWVQRLSNYTLALCRLSEAVELAGQRTLSSLEQQGLIQAFEFTHELAWNLLKDYFYWQGTSGITGSRDATREAFAAGLIDDGEAWMAMIRSRNQSSHTYNQQVANIIADAIIASYHPLLLALQTSMQQRVPT